MLHYFIQKYNIYITVYYVYMSNTIYIFLNNMYIYCFKTHLAIPLHFTAYFSILDYIIYEILFPVHESFKMNVHLYKLTFLLLSPFQFDYCCKPVKYPDQFLSFLFNK